MGLRYEDLTPETRRFMLEEIQRDEDAETLYRSPWLTQGGQGDWAEILKEAAANGTDDTLASQLRLSLTLANFEVAHRLRGTRNIGSFSTIS